VASIRRLAELEAETIYPGHGSIREDAADAIETTLAWHGRMAERAVELRHEGRSMPGLRRELLGWEGPLRWFTGGEFAKAHLARGLLALGLAERSAQA
jgi:glyoxylase-like metal-dependent hydrolase (beta-lactamase superfamily II)